MSAQSLAVMSVEVLHLKERMKELEEFAKASEADRKALWRVIYWGAGVCVGFGSIAAILIPKLVKVMGL